MATALAGFSPVNNKAGKAMSPPPPTTESINAATNPKTIKIINIDGSKYKSILVASPLVTIVIVTTNLLNVKSYCNVEI